MSAHIFDIFAKVISDLPPKAVLKALDLECKMLSKDDENLRIEDAVSILSFGKFVRIVKEGGSMGCVIALRPDHVEFYRDTIIQLVQAGELPESAIGRFNFTFGSVTSL